MATSRGTVKDGWDQVFVLRTSDGRIHSVAATSGSNGGGGLTVFTILDGKLELNPSFLVNREHNLARAIMEANDACPGFLQRLMVAFTEPSHEIPKALP